MVKVEFKGCTRCGGDIVHDRYTSDDYESYCIQCSYRPPVARSMEDERSDRLEYLRRIGIVRGEDVSVNG